MADLFGETGTPTVVNAKPKRRPSLLVRAGSIRYPHRGHERQGRDPRLTEYLAVLAEVRNGGDDDALRHVLFGGVWWLTRPQADELAGELPCGCVAPPGTCACCACARAAVTDEQGRRLDALEREFTGVLVEAQLVTKRLAAQRRVCERLDGVEAEMGRTLDLLREIAAKLYPAGPPNGFRARG
jgi:hypothetical protein